MRKLAEEWDAVNRSETNRSKRIEEGEEKKKRRRLRLKIYEK